MGKKNIKEDNMINYRALLKNKQIPILVLDNRWHELFPEAKKTPKIKELEKKLNDLLKSQGKMVNDSKDMKKKKKQLMADIVKNMDADNSFEGMEKSKKMEEDQKQIIAINEKLKLHDNELLDMPYKIKEANEQLMAESIKIMYTKFSDNKNKINKLNNWIQKAREELKMRILMKQDLEDESNKVYSYMHDLLGANIMEALDRMEQN